ncbi:MAG: V-type ATP synthase subunit F [Synergistaceae bacterium]|nr:V-type ATP synthase subunit F [Synergistaceae bacterium]
MATSGKDEGLMAAIGSYDLVMPFQAVGMETAVVDNENRTSVPHMVERYARGKYAILFVEESLYAEFKDDLEAVNENESLCVIPIPGQSGSLGIGLTSIRNSAERAVGMDIFGEK